MNIRRILELSGIKKKVGVKQYEYVDGKGRKYFKYPEGVRHLDITSKEAEKIVGMYKEGYTAKEIFERMTFHHVVTLNTVILFLRKYKEGAFKDAFKELGI